MLLIVIFGNQMNVKIDSDLKKRIDKFISKGENKYDFPSVKNFIDKAVLKLLKEVEHEK